MASDGLCCLFRRNRQIEFTHAAFQGRESAHVENLIAQSSRQDVPDRELVDNPDYCLAIYLGI